MVLNITVVFVQVSLIANPVNKVIRSRSVTLSLIGGDTDVLVLLLFHSSTNTTLHYKSDQSNRRANTLKVWDISKTKKLSGDQLCHVLPVIHAITGCDTTSSLFGIGERSSTEKSNGKNVMGNQDLIEIAGKVFNEDSTNVGTKFVLWNPAPY